LILALAAGVCLVVTAQAWLPAALKLLSQSVGSTAGEGEAGAITADAYQAQLREAAARRAKDPAWKPACQEVATIQIGDPRRPGALRNYGLNRAGEILACFAPAKAARPGEEVPAGTTAPATGALRVYSPQGELRHTWPLDIQPEAVAVAADDTIYVGGSGKILKLDPAGRVLASVESPVANTQVTLSPEVEEMIREDARQTQQSCESARDRMLAFLERRRADVTGLAVTGQDVFVAVPAPMDFTYRVYRLTRDLTEPAMIVEKLRGCCSQMDIQAREGQLWIAHNARHGVECRDRDGQLLRKFGKSGRVKADDFGGCCEPKNLRLLTGGEVLAAESGPPTCIKRFSAQGQFLEVLALIEGPGDCVRVTVAASPDGARYYLLDTTRDAIRVFARKG
jgi:hypothetical protein